MQDIPPFDDVNVQCDARGVATVTLNRPHKRNAFNDVLIQHLQLALESLSNDEKVRAVVLTGAENTFCAGMDLDHMRQQGKLPLDANINDALALASLLKTLHQLPKPVIARVNGSAFGGGIGLIAAADVAIGIETAKFAFTEVRLGIVPAVIAPYVIAAMGKQATRWFLSGAAFSASDAQKMGLLHAITPTGELDTVVDAELTQILKGGPKALAAAKELVRTATLDASSCDAQSLATLLATLRASTEGQEGLAAFNERRPPDWDIN